jgi:hypothetical protein
MPHNWSTGGHSTGLFVRIEQIDFNQVGICWMRGRLREGDLAMAVSHAGDGFWMYQLVYHEAFLGMSNRRGYRLIPQSEFGAYALGQPYRVQPTTREVHLLLAGEYIHLEADTGDPVPEPPVVPQVETPPVEPEILSRFEREAVI